MSIMNITKFGFGRIKNRGDFETPILINCDYSSTTRRGTLIGKETIRKRTRIRIRRTMILLPTTERTAIRSAVFYTRLLNKDE